MPLGMINDMDAKKITHIRKTSARYKAHFGAENVNIAPENPIFGVLP